MTALTVVGPTTTKSLISEELWNRLVVCITKEPEFQRFFGDRNQATQLEWAERIMQQTLEFLKVAGSSLNGPLFPSPEIDIGLHVFLEHPCEYESFCLRIAGRMLRHTPATPDAGALARTTAAMRASGVVVDKPLWGRAADCCVDEPSPDEPLR